MSCGAAVESSRRDGHHNAPFLQGGGGVCIVGRDGALLVERCAIQIEHEHAVMLRIGGQRRDGAGLFNRGHGVPTSEDGVRALVVHIERAAGA